SRLRADDGDHCVRAEDFVKVKLQQSRGDESKGDADIAKEQIQLEQRRRAEFGKFFKNRRALPRIGQVSAMRSQPQEVVEPGPAVDFAVGNDSVEPVLAREILRDERVFVLRYRVMQLRMLFDLHNKLQ